MEIITSSIGTYEVYDNYVIARLNGGCEFGSEEALFVRTLFSEKYQNDFGWISDCMNSYSTDVVYLGNIVKGLHKLKCAAWVNYGKTVKLLSNQISASMIEKQIKTNQFDSLPEAIEWTKSVIELSVA